jgi:hypothetical protein
MIGGAARSAAAAILLSFLLAPGALAADVAGKRADIDKMAQKWLGRPAGELPN